MSVCRLCGERGEEASLFKYGTRHYTHAACGFKKWGDAFLDKLPLYQVERLPFRVCMDNGWSIERLQAYLNKRGNRNGDAT